ncbi:MAG: oligosaccharide flippase family protein [Gammaproteobacteria bacterium]|nr:oligosaccharide flippase family protein [Gammaproteobacteria bacterium]MBU2478163.1 oligosaccharide flippase family protein [Gammaproteobacteria bacterium]
MPNKKSFRRNFSYMFASRLVFAASQWLLLVVIARLTTPHDLGLFTYSVALISPILLVTQLNMRAFMATDSNDEFTFADYLATRIFGIGLALLLIGGIALISGRELAAIAMLLLIASYKATESLSDVFNGVLQRNEHMAPIARAVSARGVTAVICMLLALQLTGSVLIGVGCILAAWILILIAHDYPVSRGQLQGPLFVPNPKVWRVIRACYPLGITLGLMSLRINIPVYIIEAHMGIEEVGYYSAIAYFLVAGNIITGSLLQTAAPRLARIYRDRDTGQFSRFLSLLVLVGGIIGLAGLLLAATFGHWILATMYGLAYAAHTDVLVWIMIAAVIGNLSQFMGLSLTVSRLFRFHLLSQCLGVIVVAVLSWILVPSQGMIGGAMALAAATTVTFLCNLVVTRARVIPSIRSQGNRML